MAMEEGVFPIGSDPHEGVFRSVSEAEVSLDEMLSLACRQGKQDIVELLLESGANVNHRNKAGNTPLLEACSQGHVSIARLLLDRSADIDAPTETTYDSALTWACTLGNVEIVRLLLDRKANVEHRTKDGCTALMFAALAGHEKVAKLLLDHHAEINVESDSNKDSPLTFACWKGHQKVVELFLERKADIEHRTKEGFSPLMFAALGGHTQVAELLLKHSARVNNPSGSNNDIPLTSACWKGHHQVVYLLLQHNSDIEHRTKDGCTPLMLAAREGHLSVAQLLLDHGAKVNMPSGSENNIPLTLACWKGHRDVVNLLLKNVSNIEHQNKAGCTPLMLAAREGHQEATRLLLDSGAQINVPSGSNDDTPLTLACWKGHEEVVSLLIERNSNVNHQTKTGCTPLMEATREGHVGVAKLLLEAGADVETPDNYGQSPFFMACWKGHADVAALLLDYDANKDCRTKTGITPLFQACRENHVDVVKLLLDYGCNPSTPFPNSRECPLTLAAEKGYVELTQLLLSRSAYVEARTKKGCSPLYLACREGFKEIAIMLAKHGASTEAADLRGTTPLLASYKNGHFEVVEWLLAHVAHLPSDPECNKALLAPMPLDTDLAPQRSKCIELIMKAKKAREQAALINAKILCEELDAEKEKQEHRRKAAAKKRQRKKKKKEQVGKLDTAELEKEEACLPVEGREGPDGEEGEESGTPPQPPLSPVSVVSGEVSAMTAPPANTHQLQKKKNSRGKKQMKMGSPEAALPLEDGSDSGDEYHDALPEFSPTEPPDHHHHHHHHPHHQDLQPQSQLRAVSPLLPPARPSATAVTSPQDHQHPSSGHASKPPLSSCTDMTATRYGAQNKRPQPKAEVSTSSTSTSPSTSMSTTSTAAITFKGATRGSETADRNRNDHVRGNQGAGLDSTSSLLGSSEKRKDKKLSRKGNAVAKDANSNQWNNQKNRSRDVGGGVWSKTPSPTTTSAPIHVIATRGVSTNSSTSSNSVQHKSVESVSGEGKPSQSQPTTATTISSSSSNARGKTTGKSSSSSSARDHRSNHTPSEPGPRDPSPALSYSSSTNESSFSSSSWTKNIYSADKSVSHAPNTSGSLTLSNQKASSYEEREDYMWSTSQESDWGNEPGLDIWASTCSTDDDKIRSRNKLKAAEQNTTAAPTPTSSSRPLATSAYPTPTTTTTTMSSSSNVSHWQEVTRPTRTVQLTVSNSLVGRIIGRGGTKINNIQVISGAHINVSRNIPKSTERLITIKGTQRSISKAQELIDEALSTPDSVISLDQERVSKHPAPGVLSTPSGGNIRSDTKPPSSKDPHPVAHIDTTKSSSRKSVPVAREVPRPVSTAGLTSTSESYTTVVCASVGRPSASQSAWSNGAGTFASVTSPSPTSRPSASNSPTQEELVVTTSGTSVTQTAPSASEKATPLSPVPVGTPGREGQKQIIDADFPPLTAAVTTSAPPPPSSPSVPHSRSQSDPLVAFSQSTKVLAIPPPLPSATVSTTQAPSPLQEPGSPPTGTPTSNNKNTEAQRSPIPITQTVSVTSSWPLTSPTATNLKLPGEQTQTAAVKDPTSTQPPSAEKLPFVTSPKSPASVEEEGVVMEGRSGKGDMSSLAVGSRPKAIKGVGVSHQQPTALPGKFLPPAASQSSSTPDLSSIPASAPPCTSSNSTVSGAGSYGAIGPPHKDRRTSLPSAPGHNIRKSSYAGFATLENVREHDPLNPVPSTFGPPLHHAPPGPSSIGGWPSAMDRRQVRSVSLTGPPPFAAHNAPFQHGPAFKTPPNLQSEDPLGGSGGGVGPPGTPDTPHGETHHIGDQDFSGPGGVYGPIGSNMPSSGGGLVSSISMRPSYDSSPLSSPRLPHPPRMKMVPSDIWMPPPGPPHHFGGPPGPRVHHVTQVLPSPGPPPFGLPFPPPPPPHAPFPQVIQSIKPSDSAHMLQRTTSVGAGYPQKQHAHGDGNGPVPNLGMRHASMPEEGSYRVGSGGAPTKRWSMPSFPGGQAPYLPPGPGGQGEHTWGTGGGGWPKQQQQHGLGIGGHPGPVGNKAVGANVSAQSGFTTEPIHSKLYGGSALSLTGSGDPWASSHWAVPQGGARGYASPAVSRFNGPGSQVQVQEKRKVKVSRSVSCVTEPSWTSLGLVGAAETEGKVQGGGCGAGDLQQLMKSLDISSEHMQALKARKLSLQQLHSMTDDEWRGLKLPVGPRVKLQNAVSNIHQLKGDSASQTSDSSSDAAPFSQESPN